jgi:hypothetical protein
MKNISVIKSEIVLQPTEPLAKRLAPLPVFVFRCAIDEIAVVACALMSLSSRTEIFGCTGTNRSPASVLSSILMKRTPVSGSNRMSVVRSCATPSILARIGGDPDSGC